jgi:YidC/Oxa1 family membrane protein insertase
MSKEPDTQSNLIIAFVLSLGVMLAWQYFVVAPRTAEEQARQKQAQVEQQVGKPPAVPGAPAAPSTPPAPGKPADIPQATPAAPVLTRTDALKQSPRLTISTPSLKGSIALKGARVDDLSLVTYHETVDPKSPNVDLLSPADAPEPYFAELGWIAAEGTGVKMPDRDSLWRIENGETLTPATPVTLAWDGGQGLIFRRTVSVDANYMFKFVDEVENKTEGGVTLYPYARIFRLGMPKTQAFYILHEGLIGVTGSKGLQELTYSSAQKESNAISVPDVSEGWVGITDKYWATALIPDQKSKFSAKLFGPTHKTATTNDSFQADFRLDGVAIAKGERRSVTTHLFAGAKQVKLLNAYESDLGIKQFSYMIDWGWFYFITKPLFYVMENINSVAGNFGLTILILTLLVKVAFFPLANKSYESMAKMKKLQPQMEQLKERFKDDKARQQQELMALYQKEKINPLAGCLPIALQIPVFFALYKVLFVTIDMRHAPFFGWIKDLSAPDPTTIFNLFGLLPFTVPEHIGPIPMHIGVWAVLMGITMWLQMQLNPKQPDPTQQMVFNWMPLFFTFLLASFPAGLVIYWAWNNLLSIAQQAYIMKKQGTEIPLKDNLKSVFAATLKLFKPGGKD